MTYQDVSFYRQLKSTKQKPQPLIVKALRIVLVKAAGALEGSHESNHRGLTAFTTALHSNLVLSITAFTTAAQPRIINQDQDLT